MARVRPRRSLVVATGLVAAFLGAGLAGVVDPLASSAETVAPNVVIANHKVVKSGGSFVVPLPVPTDATSVRLVVAAQLAWRPTKISVCSGSAVTAACKASPVMVTPVQTAKFATVTLPVKPGDRNLTVYSSAASASVTIRLASYQRGGATPAPTTASPTTAAPTAKPTATATATPKPTATATSAPKPTATATPKPTATATPKPTATATPKPTATATPKPTAAPTAAPAPPATTGRPGPGNTGVPAGTALTVHEGDLTITKDGTVVDAKEIRGLVRVEATNVVIKRTRITGRPLTTSLSLVYVAPGGSVTVEDSELYAKDHSPWIRGVIGSNFTLTRVNIHHVTDQMMITGSNVVVRDSWLHDNLYFLEDPNFGGKPTHDDNAQIARGSNLTFTNNTFEGTHNAAIQVAQSGGQVSNLKITGNSIGGGACSLNFAEVGLGAIKGVVIQDNAFQPTQKFYGCAVVSDPATLPLLALRNNLWASGKAVTVTARVGS
ncbi:right-handed parallel beta-helix repeat-containing protein [Cellulomonas edaphi]|uniref:Right-handed parallel beta-helix repeat-containing protein n=1 Tax=Cellulomonas edaphi TaxID=3053468 RepID=A0ABT7S501_9CELL|nr:right-handed parallel beta-helix repeat-containing protein [Cellulomons edaphi]MDM7830685.1 right-handed parallel beta-helix repeat-containing protein [Cellulomons edaphi]